MKWRENVLLNCSLILLELLYTYIDDLFITGTTLEEHNQRLKKVLDRAREVNLKFNKSKCIIGVTEVKFLGHVFNSEGIKPDPD